MVGQKSQAILAEFERICRNTKHVLTSGAALDGCVAFNSVVVALELELHDKAFEAIVFVWLLKIRRLLCTYI